ncbi:unnamed protein product [Dibothriocephalus latus]|uniref:Uncharacterized protein n=1 Tax=Dibothriocephalus latus TaxID=60516 RepID=A0A3P7P4T4_DIBLA|nr:unnamed protein product [Dibothriocephalus latus]
MLVTTIFATNDGIKEGQLAVLFFLHRKVDAREVAVERFFEREHLVPLYDNEGVIHLSHPEFRSVVLEDQ